jgi:hypothetical protein
LPNILGLAAISLADDNAAGFSSVPIGTTQAVLTVESNAVRWGDGAFPPTATTGNLRQPGDTILFVGNDYSDFLRRFQIINNTAGSNGTVKGVFMNGFDRA